MGHDSGTDDKDEMDATTCETNRETKAEIDMIMNEVCRMAFGLGCNPAKYQAKLKKNVQKWNGAEHREANMIEQATAGHGQDELMMLEQMVETDVVSSVNGYSDRVDQSHSLEFGPLVPDGHQLSFWVGQHRRILETRWTKET